MSDTSQLPILLVVGLVAAVLAIGWPREDEALREADNTEPEMVSIPGGTFWMGRDGPNDPADEKPVRAAEVS